LTYPTDRLPDAKRRRLGNQEKLTMVCSMVKKGLLGAALTAGGLYLVFGTAAPSYVRTAYHKVRHSAKDSVPIQFEIDRARDDIAALEPAIQENLETLARAEVDVEHLQREIAETEKNLAAEKTAMNTLYEGLKTGDLRLAKNSPIRYTTDEVKTDLGHRLDHYRFVSKILEEKRNTLKAREKAVVTARGKLEEMHNQRRNLATKLESIQASLQAIEATEDKNEFHFNDSALARAKQTVADLERRLEVKTRVAEMEGHFSGGLPVSIAPDRDVIREFDAQFGSSAQDDGAKPGDKKSL
jgi:DNA repair exonuclease SbcCD ATPase subunit